ncbi:MAG: DNA ligase, partial [Acidobacteria bacterium]|nr:DNA ligase [Acidobacteriota bacterium]
MPEHDLWLDSQVVRDLSFVSHAHTDHARRHRRALLTADTLALIPAHLRPRAHEAASFGQPLKLGGITATLLPASHMRGSAMLLLESNGSRLLYTGDMKLRLGSGQADTPIPEVDVLVMESTYGRPHFLFPDPDTVVDDIARWCGGCL